MPRRLRHSFLVVGRPVLGYVQLTVCGQIESFIKVCPRKSTCENPILHLLALSDWSCTVVVFQHLVFQHLLLALLPLCLRLLTHTRDELLLILFGFVSATPPAPISRFLISISFILYSCSILALTVSASNLSLLRGHAVLCQLNTVIVCPVLCVDRI